jgi:hypothetical protein
VLGCRPPAPEPGPNPPGLARGVAVTPKNFPRHAPEDVEAAFDLAASVARHAVFICQWSEFDPKVAELVVDQCRRRRLEPILSLSPTTLGAGRNELDLPEYARRKAGGDRSFANPAIRRAFVDAAETLARHKPRHLCLATEINFLSQRIDEYVRFASLYKEAYRAAKRVSPETKVFVSFRWEFALLLDEREPGRIEEHSKLFEIFRPELDAVALTTYPAGRHAAPADLPADYYERIHCHARRHDELLFTEAEQAAFLDRLPALLRPVRPTVVAWSLLHDVSHPALDEDLATTGLLTNDGRPKPALGRFEVLQ